MNKAFEIYSITINWLSPDKIKNYKLSKCPIEVTQFLDGVYVFDISIYDKLDEEYYQIAVKSEKNVFINDNSLLFNIPNTDIWIIKGEWRISARNSKYHHCPSINTVGDINLKIDDSKILIRVAPNIENFDFQALKNDFNGELWDLITSNSSKVQTETSKIRYGDKVFRFAESKSIINFIHEFERIITNPKHELKATTHNTSIIKVRPVLSTYRNIARFGYDSLLPSKTSIPNYDIYENKFLCLMLYKISQIVIFNINYSEQQKRRLDNEIDNIEIKILQLEEEPTVNGEEILNEINNQKNFYKSWKQKWQQNKESVLAGCDNSNCRVNMVIEIRHKSDDYDYWVMKGSEFCLMSFPVNMDSIFEEQKSQKLRLIAYCYQSGSAGKFPKYEVNAIKEIELLSINYSSIIAKQEANYERLKTGNWLLSSILKHSEKKKLEKERENQIKTLRKRIDILKIQISNLSDFSTEINELSPALNRLLNHQFTVSISYRNLSHFKPSMTFLQNFHYRNALKYYQEVLNSEGIDISVFGFYEEILQYSIREIPQIYELWCLISIINSIESTYSLKSNKHDIKKLLKNIQPNNKKLEIYSEIGFSGNLPSRNIILHYQKKIEDKRPDFILEIRSNDRTICLVLDAKFKNYNYKLSASEEIRLLTEKYQIDSSHFVFSLHPCNDLFSNDKKTRLTNLGGEHIFSLQGDVELPFHKFGYIQVIPQNTDNLKKLIGMSLEYLLEYDHNAKQSDRSIDPEPDYEMICLSCGADNMTQTRNTRGNNRFSYVYNCNNPDCQHSVYIDYCWNCKTKLFKHGSFWDYHKTSVWSAFDIHCPCCGMTVADMPN